MGLRISTNTASLMAQHRMARTSRETEKALAQMATGSRFEGSSDAAGHAIAVNLQGQLKGLQAAKYNSEVAQSFVQSAEGSLNEQNNILVRLRELAVQSASDTYSDKEREFIDMEFQQLKDEFDRIAKTTTYGATPLLNGSGNSYEFQVGVHGKSEDKIVYENNTDTTGDTVGISDLSVTSDSEAQSALSSVDEAMSTIGSARASFGAIQSRLESTESALSSQIENIEAAHSRVADADIAEAVSKAQRGMILQKFQAAVLASANQTAENALRLVG